MVGRTNIDIIDNGNSIIDKLLDSSNIYTTCLGANTNHNYIVGNDNFGTVTLPLQKGCKYIIYETHKISNWYGGDDPNVLSTVYTNLIGLFDYKDIDSNLTKSNLKGFDDYKIRFMTGTTSNSTSYSAEYITSFTISRVSYNSIGIRVNDKTNYDLYSIAEPHNGNADLAETIMFLFFKV